ICDQEKEAFFSLDMVVNSNTLYRIICRILPTGKEKYSIENFKLEVRKENIRVNDSYESCVKRIEEKAYLPAENYIDELEKIESLDWIFEYPEDTRRVLRLPDNDERFRFVLESILKALDPAIISVEISQDVKNAYVIRLKDRAVILQDGERFTTEILSSGTKAGVEVARVVAALMQRQYSFCYCDEKFPYIHTDIEKAVLSLMIEYLQPNDQLFFTTHNTDILEMTLPKHAFTFMRKNTDSMDCPITCIDASSLLKRSTDSLKNAVDNDLFSCSPAVDLIYAIADC
ncbi:MAG: ATP-binding protein, partial [Tyzzerella sp.]|nr:ATP-binding protein [Tyzzerella sp.]